jgi:hypothetical protein
MSLLPRNPNFPRDPTKVQPKGSKGRGGSTFDWDPYDPTYKKYLHIGEAPVGLL